MVRDHKYNFTFHVTKLVETINVVTDLCFHRYGTEDVNRMLRKIWVLRTLQIEKLHNLYS
jgi:hypothetical protein